MALSSNDTTRTIVNQYLSRRGLLGGAAAAGAVFAFGFHKTKEIAAQQLTGTSLYDQLGGLVGISKVVQDFVANVVTDERIKRFFEPTVAAGRGPRLTELLIQQIAEASGGPVKYTGADMKTAHAEMGISGTDFAALVEDLVKSLQSNNVAVEAQTMLLGALAPMANDIVTATPS